MEKTILSLYPVEMTLDSLLSALHLDMQHGLIDDIIEVYQSALEVAKPVAVFAPFPIDDRDGAIWLNGVKLDEPFVHIMLSGSSVVVPYVASCGKEIDAWSKAYDGDCFEQFVADTIKQLCLEVVCKRLFGEVREKHFSTGFISTINPGSICEWPTSSQPLLFDIIGNVTDDIGVVLSDSCLMIPSKSWSGIMFRTDQEFHNCQLCPKLDCPNRKAPYGGSVSRGRFS